MDRFRTSSPHCNPPGVLGSLWKALEPDPRRLVLRSNGGGLALLVRWCRVVWRIGGVASRSHTATLKRWLAPGRSVSAGSPQQAFVLRKQIFEVEACAASDGRVYEAPPEGFILSRGGRPTVD